MSCLLDIKPFILKLPFNNCYILDVQFKCLMVYWHASRALWSGSVRDPISKTKVENNWGAHSLYKMYFYKPREHSRLLAFWRQQNARKDTGNILSNRDFLVPLEHFGTHILISSFQVLWFLSTSGSEFAFHLPLVTLLELKSEDLFPPQSLEILLYLFTLFLAVILECLCAHILTSPSQPIIHQVWIIVAACMEADLHMLGSTGSNFNSVSFVV